MRGRSINSSTSTLALTRFQLIIVILEYPLHLLSLLQVLKKILRNQANQITNLYFIPVKGSCSLMKMDLPRALAVVELSRCSKKEVY